jgi:VIT family
MVLTVTLTAGLTVAEGKEGVRQLLLAAIGCNIAWGLIDAVMYIMNCITVRNGKIRLIEAVQRAPDTASALNLVRSEIEPELQDLLEPDDAEKLNLSVLKHIAHVRIGRTKVSKEDLYGAVACFWLVFVSCLPAALPFFFFARPHLALRISNFLLIGLLFLVGQKWAQYAGTNRLAAGFAMVVLGLVLVAVAILLGG